MSSLVSLYQSLDRPNSSFKHFASKVRLTSLYSNNFLKSFFRYESCLMLLAHSSMISELSEQGL